MKQNEQFPFHRDTLSLACVLFISDTFWEWAVVPLIVFWIIQSI